MRRTAAGVLEGVYQYLYNNLEWISLFSGWGPLSTRLEGFHPRREGVSASSFAECSRDSSRTTGNGCLPWGPASRRSESTRARNTGSFTWRGLRGGFLSSARSRRG